MKRRPSPALVVAIVALVVAMGGTSYAAVKLPKNSVGASQIAKNAVAASEIKAGGVGSPELKNGSVTPADLQAGTLPGLTVTTVDGNVAAQGAYGSGAESATSTATCPAGSTVVGGGYDASGSNESVRVARRISASQYQVVAVNYNSTAQSVTAQAICAKVE